eukprot:evm.model.scf_1687.2 EVM.evm.TU.scf_1687.2   scf_1687:18314-19597(+)
MQELKVSTCSTLNDFFRKSLKLSLLRLFEIQRNIKATASHVLTHQVYLAMQFALYERTKLFYNRHLDQMLMCVIYGICKVHGVNVPFRQLISHYVKKAKGSASVYTTVVLKQTEPGLWVQEFGDIVRFYNKVFIPAMGSYLMSIAGEGGQQQPEDSSPIGNRYVGCQQQMG